MEHVAKWHVTLYFFDHEEGTTARAVLTTGVTTIHGEGHTGRNPDDRPVTEIGTGLAAGRALADMAAQLMAVGADDVAGVSSPG
ncbi:dsRBD fold-containing protein [Nakamurella sp. PAMC28650]|uniref:dsRBD fold-containing protein n=1 Tax=Nakamurella sp. PAMC28650 TaxID=2762325 RepID=UPI00164E9D27|nr:dsRBD fold-containing protein [Nakamurella sp. PAMC28650]QNK80261.1 DUF1876 family protein [Nakamurella sp. PAMC28650]